MSITRVREYFRPLGMEERIMEVPASSATVEEAAAALGCEPARIAKSISIYTPGEEGAVLIVAAGDVRIDNKKFKNTFGYKPRMLRHEDVERMTGHAIGGVCPFGINEAVKVYLDVSLRRFETVFPAAGSGNSMIELSLEELAKYGKSQGWVDIGKQRPEIQEM